MIIFIRLVFVQLFHFCGNDNYLLVVIKVKLLNLNIYKLNKKC